jgi:DNA-binding transcriptional MerR regulator
VLVLTIKREVPFITLGDAAEMLGAPPATLRGWADMLENLGVHALERNQRNERLFYENDLEIFRFVKDQKDVHGRKTTTEDLAHTINQMAEDGAFELRKTGLDVPIPVPPPTLTYVDLDRLTQQETFRQWFEEIHAKLNEQTHAQIIELQEQNKQLANLTQEKIESLQKEVEAVKKENAEKLDKILEQQEKRDKDTVQYMKQTLAMKQYLALPGWKRMFTKAPQTDTPE